MSFGGWVVDLMCIGGSWWRRGLVTQVVYSRLRSPNSDDPVGLLISLGMVSIPYISFRARSIFFAVGAWFPLAVPFSMASLLFYGLDFLTSHFRHPYPTAQVNLCVLSSWVIIYSLFGPSRFACLCYSHHCENTPLHSWILYHNHSLI